MSLGAQKSTRPVQKLAGKRTERAVMRNGTEANRPRQGIKGTRDISVLADIGECPSGTHGISGQTLTVEQQRLEALRKGDLVRMDRADARRRLRRGELDWDSFLDEPPASCLQVPVMKVLQWLPHIGRFRAREILSEVPGVDLAVLVSELSCRAKYALSHQVTVFYGQHWTRGRRPA